MNSQKRHVPLYQRYSEGGHRTKNLAGVQAAIKTGDDPATDSVTWLVQSDTLAGLAPLAEYDVMRDTAGRWWTVKEVGAPADGVYSLRCERWKDGVE